MAGPALAGQTPRAAARSAKGRELLLALLDEFEWGDGADVPIARLKTQLGLRV
jgi:hypothetical protein